MKFVFFFGFLCTGLVGCGGGRNLLRDEARDDFLHGRLESAEQKVRSPEVVQETKNRLLTLMDLGIVSHAQGQYERSNRYFYAAKRVAQQLYTESVSEKVLTGLVNDNSATYPGTDYENGHVYYFLILNHLLIAQAGRIPSWVMPELKDGDTVVFPEEQHPERILTDKQMKESLVRARAETLAWDSFLEQVRNRNKGEPYYKDDALNKVLASQVHRMMGTRQDLSTAKILLDQAQKLLVKSLSAYPAFNSKSKEYVAQYSDFEQLGQDAVQSGFIQPTENYQVFAESVKSLQADVPNLFVVIEAGLIPLKSEKTYTIGLSTLFGQINDPGLRAQIEQVGVHALLELAPGLGLVTVGAGAVGAATADKKNPPQFMSEAVDSLLGFEFKLPTIVEEASDSPYVLIAKNTATGEEVSKVLPVASPLNEIAHLNVERRAGQTALKTGVRVGMKYLGALVAAVIVSKKMKDDNALLRWLAVSGTYIAAKKLIDHSEAADTRQWNLLPAGIQLGGVKLSPGSYQVSVKAKHAGKEQVLNLGTVSVSDQKPVFLKSRIFE